MAKKKTGAPLALPRPKTVDADDASPSRQHWAAIRAELLDLKPEVSDLELMETELLDRSPARAAKRIRARRRLRRAREAKRKEALTAEDRAAPERKIPAERIEELAWAEHALRRANPPFGSEDWLQRQRELAADARARKRTEELVAKIIALDAAEEEGRTSPAVFVVDEDPGDRCVRIGGRRFESKNKSGRRRPVRASEPTSNRIGRAVLALAAGETETARLTARDVREANAWLAHSRIKLELELAASGTGERELGAIRARGVRLKLANAREA